MITKDTNNLAIATPAVPTHRDSFFSVFCDLLHFCRKTGQDIFHDCSLPGRSQRLKMCGEISHHGDTQIFALSPPEEAVVSGL